MVTYWDLDLFQSLDVTPSFLPFTETSKGLWDTEHQIIAVRDSECEVELFHNTTDSINET